MKVYIHYTDFLHISWTHTHWQESIHSTHLQRKKERKTQTPKETERTKQKRRLKGEDDKSWERKTKSRWRGANAREVNSQFWRNKVRAAPLGINMHHLYVWNHIYVHLHIHVYTYRYMCNCCLRKTESSRWSRSKYVFNWAHACVRHSTRHCEAMATVSYPLSSFSLVFFVFLSLCSTTTFFLEDPRRSSPSLSYQQQWGDWSLSVSSVAPRLHKGLGCQRHSAGARNQRCPTKTKDSEVSLCFFHNNKKKKEEW